jgi:hypothetical protein
VCAKTCAGDLHVSAEEEEGKEETCPSKMHVSVEHRQTRWSAALHGVGKLKNLSNFFSDSMDSFSPTGAEL